MSESELPAWSLPADAAERIGLAADWPAEITREWAWGGSTGRGVRVCILDSGVETGHPLIGSWTAQSPRPSTGTASRS